MDGTSQPLICHGFIEGEGFKLSKKRLKELFEWTDEDIDVRLDSLIWAFQSDPHPDEAPLTRRSGDRNLWVARIDHPHLRVYLRPRVGVQDECELMWIEEVD
jgi:hypothetical protein